MQSFKRYAPLLVFAMIVVAVFASGTGRYLNLDALRRNEALLRGFVERHLFLSIAAYIAVYAVATAVSIPGALVLTLAGGFLFGTWLGGSATVVGATAGAIIVFAVVRTSLGVALRERAERTGGRLKSVMDGIHSGAFGYILTLRLIPLAPFWLVNVAAALADAPLRAYCVATLIGIIPATFIYSSIGSGLGQVLAHGGRPDLHMIFEPYIFIPLTLLGLLSLGGTLVQRRLSRKSGAA